MSTLFPTWQRPNTFIDFFTFHLANITHFPMTQLRKYHTFSLTLLLSIYQISQISQLPTIDRPSTFVEITTLHISYITDFPITHHTQTKHSYWHYYSPHIKYYRFPNDPPYTDQALLLTLLLSIYQILQISQFGCASIKLVIYRYPLVNIYKFPIGWCTNFLCLYVQIYD